MSKPLYKENSLLLHKEELVFPVMIWGTNISDLEVNILSDDYSITVARDMLEEESRIKMANKLLRIIYEKLLSEENEMVDEEDKIAMREFAEKIEDLSLFNNLMRL